MALALPADPALQSRRFAAGSRPLFTGESWAARFAADSSLTAIFSSLANVFNSFLEPICQRFSLLNKRRNTLLQKFVEVRGNSELAPSIGHFVEGVKDRSIIPRIETLGHTEIARSTIGRHNNWVVINSKIAGSQDIGKNFFCS